MAIIFGLVVILVVFLYIKYEHQKNINLNNQREINQQKISIDIQINQLNRENKISEFIQTMQSVNSTIEDLLYREPQTNTVQPHLKVTRFSSINYKKRIITRIIENHSSIKIHIKYTNLSTFQDISEEFTIDDFYNLNNNEIINKYKNIISKFNLL